MFRSFSLDSICTKFPRLCRRISWPLVVVVKICVKKLFFHLLITSLKFYPLSWNNYINYVNVKKTCLLMNINKIISDTRYCDICHLLQVSNLIYKGIKPNISTFKLFTPGEITKLTLKLDFFQ